MVNLKELISLLRFLSQHQQVESDEIPWDTEVRLESNLVVKKLLKNISSENWNKISHVAPGWSSLLWSDSLIKQIEKSNKLIGDNKKFVNERILQGFKEYAETEIYPKLKVVENNKEYEEIEISEVNEDHIIDTSRNEIAIMLRDSNKIFVESDGNHAFQSKDALDFLQSIISDDFFNTIEYKKGEMFKLEEWKNDDLNELDVEAEIIINARKIKKLLSRTYSESELEEKKELDISSKNLIGELDLSRFTNLEKLDCSHNQLFSLKLDKNTELTYLDCSHNQLRKKLDLTDNKKLTKLDCSFNKLEELVIVGNPNWEMLVCNDNELKNNLQEDILGKFEDPKKLVHLNISDNNLAGDLGDFKNFTNLELLWIGSENKERIKRGIYNKFSGSLESLENLKKLGSLDVSNCSNCLSSSGNLDKIKEKLREKSTKLKEELGVLTKKLEEIEGMQQALIEVTPNN
jgi:hypothetical protein